MYSIICTIIYKDYNYYRYIFIIKIYSHFPQTMRTFKRHLENILIPQDSFKIFFERLLDIHAVWLFNPPFFTFKDCFYWRILKNFLFLYKSLHLKIIIFPFFLHFLLFFVRIVIISSTVNVKHFLNWKYKIYLFSYNTH